MLVRVSPDWRDVRVQLCDQLDAEARKLARFTLGIAYKLHRGVEPRREPPDVGWFVQNSDVLGLAPTGRRDGYHVHIARDLKGRRLVRAVLHEARHIAQHNVSEFDDDYSLSEEDACGFERRWTELVLMAFELTAGCLSEISVLTNERKPWRCAPDRHVAVTRSNTGLWSYSDYLGQWNRRN